MKSHKSLTRRRFLGGVIAAAAAPQFLPGRMFGQATAPSRKIQLGHIGTGNQGTPLLQNFLGVQDAVSVAIADPFTERREAAAKRVMETQGHEPKLYNDFRELLADESIDAVVIATPDHWHVPIALAAVRAGKGVYVEKPLGYTMDQNQALLKVCQEHKAVFQYGTQQRSQELLKRGIELVLNGYIGDLERVEVWAPGGAGGGSLEEIPVPPGLDYDLYIGPAPMEPCTKDRITNKGSWFCSDYSIGFISGWGAHPLSKAIWGMDYDQQGPATFRGTGDFPTPNALFNTCATWDVEIKFGGGVQMHFMSANHAEAIVKTYRKDWQGGGTTFFGSKGWISLSRGSADASNPDWLKLRQCEGDRRVTYHKNYYQAFVNSVRDGAPAIAPIEDSVRSDAISHLSLMAIKSGGEVVWDPAKYRIVTPEALNSQMSTEIRGPWKQS